MKKPLITALSTLVIFGVFSFAKAGTAISSYTLTQGTSTYNFSVQVPNTGSGIFLNVWNGIYPSTPTPVVLQEGGPCTSFGGSLSSGICTFSFSVPISSFTSGNGYFDISDIGTGNDYYAQFLSGGSATSLPTEFIEPYNPPDGSFSTTSPTTFSGQFFNNCSDINLDTLSISLLDTNTGSQQTIPAGNAQICGQGTFSATIALNLGDTYLWRPQITSSAGTSTPIYGNYYSFQATSSPAYSPLPQSVGSATSTLPNAYNLLTFLNVPNLLQTKIPFAYLFQIYAGITQGISSSSASSIPSGNLTITGLGQASTTFDMFSPATIEYYLSPTLIALWRGFLLVVLYVEFGYALYNRIKPKNHTDLI